MPTWRDIKHRDGRTGMDFDPTAYWKWLCRCCGDTAFRSERPRDCPTCYAPAEEFVRLSELVEDE